MNNSCRKYLRLSLMLILLYFLNPLIGQTLKKVKRQITLRSLAHVRGIEQYGIGGGINYDGFNIALFYGKYLKKNLFLRGDLFYERATLSSITTLRLYYFSPEVNYTIAKFTNRFFINLKGGFIVGNERLSNDIMVNKKLSTFIVGEKVGAKFEFFIIPDFSLNLDLEQRFINNSKAGSNSPLVYISFGYNI